MKNHLLFIVLLIAILPYKIVQSQHEHLIMTWNIRLDVDTGSLNWTVRRDSLIHYIEKKNPDIIGFQEVLHNQLVDILDKLSQYSFIGVGRKDSAQNGEYAPLFFRNDRYTKINENHFWLSETPSLAGSIGWDAACERIVSWVQLKDRKTDEVFWVFNTHFDHVGKTARKQSALLIVEQIKQVTQGGAVVLMGDFNATPEEESYQTFLLPQQKLHDSRTSASLLLSPSNAVTYTGFDKLAGNDALIDYIFFSEKFQSTSYEVGQTIVNNFFFSDHFPVLTSVKLK